MERAGPADLMKNVAAFVKLRGSDDDFEMGRVEALSAGRKRRKYRGADKPRHLRSPLCRQRRAALIRCGRQCGPGAVAARGRLEIVVRTPGAGQPAGSGISHL